MDKYKCPSGMSRENNYWALKRPGSTLTAELLHCMLLCVSRLAKEGILNLSVSERILLVEDIWDSIAELPDAVVLTEDQKRVLDNRLDAYRSGANAGSPWHTVCRRIQKRG